MRTSLDDIGPLWDGKFATAFQMSSICTNKLLSINIANCNGWHIWKLNKIIVMIRWGEWMDGGGREAVTFSGRQLLLLTNLTE